MMPLNATPSPAASDELYDLLAQAHESLDPIASSRLNSMLILLLVNHIGTLDIVREAIEVAHALLDKQSFQSNV